MPCSTERLCTRARHFCSRRTDLCQSCRQGCCCRGWHKLARGIVIIGWLWSCLLHYVAYTTTQLPTIQVVRNGAAQAPSAGDLVTVRVCIVHAVMGVYRLHTHAHVYTQVTRVTARVAAVDIVCIDTNPLHEPFKGIIRCDGGMGSWACDDGGHVVSGVVSYVHIWYNLHGSITQPCICSIFHILHPTRCITLNAPPHTSLTHPSHHTPIPPHIPAQIPRRACHCH